MKVTVKIARENVTLWGDIEIPDTLSDVMVYRESLRVSRLFTDLYYKEGSWDSTGDSPKDGSADSA